MSRYLKMAVGLETFIVLIVGLITLLRPHSTLADGALGLLIAGMFVILFGLLGGVGWQERGMCQPGQVCYAQSASESGAQDRSTRAGYLSGSVRLVVFAVLLGLGNMLIGAALISLWV